MDFGCKNTTFGKSEFKGRAVASARRSAFEMSCGSESANRMKCTKRVVPKNARKMLYWPPVQAFVTRTVFVIDTRTPFEAAGTTLDASQARE